MKYDKINYLEYELQQNVWISKLLLSAFFTDNLSMILLV